MRINSVQCAQRPTPNAQRPTPNAQRPTPNAQRPTPNAQRPTLNYTQKDEIIHVVLCVYDPSGNYSQNAGVVMTSIFEKTQSKVLVHILHDDTLTEDNRQKFLRTAEKYSQGVNLIDVTEYAKQFSEKVVFNKRGTLGALFRIVIQDVINVEKVIYLDCDIVVNLDINELWNIDTENYCIAGVLDEVMTSIKFFTFNNIRTLLNGVKSSNYINSGVLVMNLKEIRSRGDFFKDAVDFVKYHPYTTQLTDQDLINALFNGSIKFIDKKFNRHVNHDGDLTGTIIHSIVHKQWKTLSNSQPHKIYWEMYVKSAWGENMTTYEIVEKISEIARSAMMSSPFYHGKSAGQCVRRLVRAFTSRLKFITEPLSIISLVVKDTFFRIKCKFFS